METYSFAAVEQIQKLAASIIARQSVGHQLYLIGGFRYRLLDASCRTSVDIDYHWEGDLDEKQAEIVDVLRKKLVPEVKRQFAYDGDIRPAAGPTADSPAVRGVQMAFYRLQEPGSRIEIPLEITRISRLDPPAVRTVAGTVFLTISDADMIESKIVALLSRHFTQARDILDIFLFQDRVRADAWDRLARKFREASLSPADVSDRLARLWASSAIHIRGIERTLDAQVDPAVTANLRLAGGAAMVWECVRQLLVERLSPPGDDG